MAYAHLEVSDPIDVFPFAMDLWPGDTWQRDVVMTAVNTGAPVDLTQWTFAATLGGEAGAVATARAAEGCLTVRFESADTADVTAGTVMLLTGAHADGSVRTFARGVVGGVVGQTMTSSAPLGGTKKLTLNTDLLIEVRAGSRGDQGEDGEAVSLVLVTRAELARDGAVTARAEAQDAAASAAGSAGDAEGAAAEAAASSESASTGASQAEVARAGAALARSGAEVAESAAQAARTGAEVAKAGAETARGQAQTARTEAQTARTGAETARTGSETAKTAAEAARDVALSQTFAGVALGSADLNTIQTAGSYFQATSALATLAANYPREGVVATLDVRRVSAGNIVQTLTVVQGAGATFPITYSRRLVTSTWSVWRLEGAHRIVNPPDQPGMEFWAWDGVNTERLISPSNVPLGDVDLNSVTLAGTYFQSSTLVGTLALNYPITGTLGTLEVFGGGGQQRYTPRSAVFRGSYLRSFAGGAWTPWVFESPMRVDLTAGRAIYMWDPVNSREQLVYGDSGWRDVTALTGGGWDSVTTATNFVYLRRSSVWEVELMVRATATDPSPATELIVLPAGWRSRLLGVPFTPSFVGANPDAAVVQKIRAAARNDGVVDMPAASRPAPGGQLYAHLSWTTTEAWPTSLPGTAVGTIPNL